MYQNDPPEAAPPIATRAEFDAALAEQVEREKEVTRHNDRVSAARRRLPMVEVENYTFEGPDGPTTLTDLFGDRYLLMVQNVMFDPGWDDGCPSCSWAVDNLPANMHHLTDEGIAFAMISQAPIEKLERWRAKRGWDHLWVSSGQTSYHDDWGWTQKDERGQEGQAPGYSYYLLRDGRPYLTYMTTARGTGGHPADGPHHGPHRLRSPAGLGGQPRGLAPVPHLRLRRRRRQTSAARWSRAADHRGPERSGSRPCFPP